MKAVRTAQKHSAGIDFFRLAAACMVVAIHTAPLSSVSEDADYLLTYCLGRVAVPFFLMTSGYFVLAPYIWNKAHKKQSLRRFLIKNALLYFAVSLLYLPISLYSGNLPKHAGELCRNVFFDGTFYHLWYFPAAILGCIIVITIAQRSVGSAVLLSGAAYLIGVFGDSWYGLIKDFAPLRLFYDGIFTVTGYTRNGIFFTPIFLLLGVLLANPKFRCKKKVCLYGTAVAVFCMLLEGYASYGAGMQRHNSMYLFLPPVMYFLFQLLLSVPGASVPLLRKTSMLVYLIHPAVILAVRGFAKLIHQTGLFVTNSLIHYLLVCGISWIAAILLEGGKRLCIKKDAHGSN